MTTFVAEIIGTAILILLGDGVVANVMLKESKAHGAGWVVIAIGWGLAVFVAVFTVAAKSGAHINPAVTLGLALAGKFSWSLVPTYLAGQFIGAAVGAFMVWAYYRLHFVRTEDKDLKLSVFCTMPAIRNRTANLLSEIIGTFVLVFAVLEMAAPEIGLGALDAIPVALVVLAIGMSLGGTTGYAINPARDLSPRIMHALLPVADKRDSDWGYAWIPVVGPLVGGAIAAGLHRTLTGI